MLKTRMFKAEINKNVSSVRKGRVFLELWLEQPNKPLSKAKQRIIK